MAIRALHDIKDIPLPLVVDMYEKAIVPSIAEEYEADYIKMSESLAYDYFATNLEAKCPLVDWSEAQNNLEFSKEYINIFAHPIEGIWVAYEALSFIYSFAKDGKAGRIQAFEFKGKKFLIGLDNQTVVFVTPKERISGGRKSYGEKDQFSSK